MSFHCHQTFRALLALLLFSCAGAAQAAICRVTATGTGDGSDWPQAASLQNALASPTCTDIWVAQGTYTPDGGSGNRTAHFAIARNLRLYGGFSGSETSFEERASTDPTLTILSGEIGDPAEAGDNSYKLLLIDARAVTGGITAATVIDGFTLRDAYGDGNFPNNLGSALLCRSNRADWPCSPTLTRLHFIRNYAINGGAIGLFVECCLTQGGGVSSPTISDTVFTGNSAQRSGGALYAMTQGPGSRIAPTIERTLFLDNAAHLGTTIGPGGGAIYVSAGGQSGIIDLDIRNATFVGNRSPMGSHSSNSYGRGGAIYNDGLGGTSKIRLDHVTFSGNKASFQGEPEYAGQAIYAFSTGASTLITRSIIADAHAFRRENSASITLQDSVVPPGAPCPTHAACIDIIEGDPLLGLLQDNGGDTPTMLPDRGGAGVDAVDCGDASTDQRGITRPQGARCDAGAVEHRMRTMTLDVDGQGSIAVWLHPGGGSVPTCTGTDAPCTFAYGENEDPQPKFTFTASPGTGWEFDQWSGDCTVDDTDPQQAHVTLDDDRSCTARFALKHYVVTFAADPVGSGSLAAQGGIDPDDVPHGTALDLIATPHPGWNTADPALYPPVSSCGTATGATLQPDGTLEFSLPPILGECSVIARFANQPPGFEVPDAHVTALVNGAPVAIADWATDIRNGDAHDPAQSVQFHLDPIGTTPPGAQLFPPGGTPTLDADGTLRFTPGPDTGSAMFHVVLSDDAGSDNGGNDTSTAALLFITLTQAATDLSIHAEVPATFNYPGDRIHFALRVENAGPYAAEQARMQWAPPLELDLAGIEWICEPSGAALCTASGNGAIDDGIDIPANGALHYLIQATLPTPSPAEIHAQAQVVSGPDQADPDPSDDTVTWHVHIEGLFKDGLEEDEAR